MTDEILIQNFKKYMTKPLKECDRVKDLYKNLQPLLNNCNDNQLKYYHCNNFLWYIPNVSIIYGSDNLNAINCLQQYIYHMDNNDKRLIIREFNKYLKP